MHKEENRKHEASQATSCQSENKENNTTIMPFLGQDWRAPGEQWVKTSEGWERLKMWRLKMFENLNENVVARWLREWSVDNLKDKFDLDPKGHTLQPHIHIMKGSTKEQAAQMSVSDAFSRLDMAGASKDLRRSNYVLKLLELLIQRKLPSLSGSAQKQVMHVLEEAVLQVAKTQNNANMLHQLLKDLKTTLSEGHYHHVGSAALWSKHLSTVDRLQNTLNSIQFNERGNDGGVRMSDLPDDCVLEILSRLSDHRDIINTGLTEERVFDLTQEKGIWKELCLFHFDNFQIMSLIRDESQLQSYTCADWKVLYKRLVKRYDMKATYAEMLYLCKHCNALYWQHHGHPCLVQNVPDKAVPVSPVMCMEVFTS